MRAKRPSRRMERAVYAQAAGLARLQSVQWSPGYTDLSNKSNLASISTEVHDDVRLEDLYTWD